MNVITKNISAQCRHMRPSTQLYIALHNTDLNPDLSFFELNISTLATHAVRIVHTIFKLMPLCLRVRSNLYTN